VGARSVSDRTKPDQWMPLDIRDYLADTTHLSAEDHGAYLLLLMGYWMRGGPLEDNDRQLAQMARISSKKWPSIRLTLSKFFTIENGKWAHKRCEKELGRARELLEARREAGRIGGEAARGKSGRKPNSKTIANLIANEWQKNTPPHTPNTLEDSSLREESSGELFKAEKERLPDWIPPEQWDGYVAMRKKIRAPLSDRAITLTIAKLKRLKDEGNDPGAVLDQSTENSWRGVFELRKVNGSHNGLNGSAVQHFEPTDESGWLERVKFYFKHPEFKEHRWNNVKWGPPPIDPNTKVPDAVLARCKNLIEKEKSGSLPTRTQHAQDTH
jgi:uncharacterized protein YdaU (DUF1376 family)